MKGLDVWNAVKKYLNLYHKQAVKEDVELKTVEGMPIDIIEKELKRLEEIDNGAIVPIHINRYNELSDKEEALRIIKNKNVFVWGFIHRQEETKDFEPTYEYYKSHYGYFHSGYDISNNLLTQEEYDLLKEVLL